jgi:hypothetical protein
LDVELARRELCVPEVESKLVFLSTLVGVYDSECRV